ncbi:hypothetical protein EON63_03530 [archaeon]|nr:MAG: hypothetical protein EON63_03530 [archaeon]
MKYRPHTLLTPYIHTYSPCTIHISYIHPTSPTVPKTLSEVRVWVCMGWGGWRIRARMAVGAVYSILPLYFSITSQYLVMRYVRYV